MHPLQIREHLRAQPFVPFRIHLSDGSQYEVPHRDFAFVTTRQVTIATELTDEGLPERTVYCDPLHVTRIEPLNGGQRKRTSKRRKKRS